MDHHCPWLGNCIGLMNHKYFINFLFHVLLGVGWCIFIYIYSRPTIAELTADTHYFVSLLLAFSVEMSCAGLLMQQLANVTKNGSTIERASFFYQNPFKVPCATSSKLESAIVNLRETFGSDPLWRWFLPLEPLGRVYDGVKCRLYF